MKQGLFRTVISVREGMEGQINLREITGRILSAKDEFNSREKDKQLFIIGIYEDYIAVILNMKIEDECRRVSTKNLSGFVNIIYSKSDLNKRMLKIYSFRDIDLDEYKSVVDSLNITRCSVYDPEDARRIMKAVTGDLEDSKDNAAKDEHKREEAESARKTSPFRRDRDDFILNPGISYEEAEKELDSLVGLNDVKKEIKKICGILSNNSVRNKRICLDCTKIPCNILLMGNLHTGRETIAKILYKMFFHLGIVNNKKFIKIESCDLGNWHVIENAARDNDGGVIYIDEIGMIIPPEEGKNRRVNSQFDNFLKDIEKYKDKFVFIFSGSSCDVDKLIRTSIINEYFKFKISIPDYNVDELELYGKKLLEDKKYVLDISGKETLRLIIHSMRGANKLDNMQTVILSSVQTPFNVGDEKKLPDLIEKVQNNFEIKPEEVSADKVYGSINNRAYLKDNEIIGNIDFYDDPDKEYEKFDLKKFYISEDLAIAKCPNGCITATAKLSRDGKEVTYKFSEEDCINCPLREQCFTEADIKRGVKTRKVTVNIRYDAVLTDKKRNETKEFKEALDKRCSNQ